MKAGESGALQAPAQNVASVPEQRRHEVFEGQVPRFDCSTPDSTTTKTSAPTGLMCTTTPEQVDDSRLKGDVLITPDSECGPTSPLRVGGKT